MNNDNATSQIWDKVAEKYNEYIWPEEEKLAIEIKKLFNKLGIWEGDKILELGSGSGHLSFMLNEMGYETDLLDFSSKSLAKSQKLFNSKKLNSNFINQDLTKKLNIDTKYSVAWNSGVMEHFDEKYLRKIFNNIYKINADYFLFIVPNPKSIIYLLYRHKLITEDLWDVGMEYLRKNYIEIIETSGFKHLNTYYLGTEYTVSQFKRFLNQELDVNYINEMFENELIEESQKYLVGYVFSKKDIEGKSKKIRDELKPSVDLAKYDTKIFDLLSEKYGSEEKYKNIKLKYNNLEKEYQKIEEKRKTIEKNSQILQEKKEDLKKKNKYLEKELENYKFRNNRKDEQLIRIKNEINQVKMLKPYRIAHGMRRFKFQFYKGNKNDKIEYFKWIGRKLKKVNYKEDQNHNPIENIEKNILNIIENKNLIADNSTSASMSQEEYRKKYLSEAKNENTLLIENIIKGSQYKGIVIYPDAVKWNPMQRPQQLLREFSKLGYLCIFIEHDNNKIEDKIIYEKIYENLYVAYDSMAVLYALQIYNPIILCTWIPQLKWINLLPNKFIWYDVLDELDFFSEYNEEYLNKHKLLLQSANFVSYTAEKLHKYVYSRSDARLIPNAVNLRDFEKNQIKKISKLENLKSKKIVGYYGAVEEWFDEELVLELANENQDLEIIIIGKVGIDKSKLDLCKNIHFIGEVPYKELIDYSKYFDVSIIPFKVNNLTNSISPVKFFEYSAIGKPIVSTDIHEIRRYECNSVLLGKDKVDFKNKVRQALIKFDDGLNLDLRQISENNTWRGRVLEFIKCNENYEMIKTSANLINSNCVDVYTPSFLDNKGYNFYAGGAERYLIDLSNILNSKNINFNIYQYGDYPWVRKFKNMTVVSLAKNAEKLNYAEEKLNQFSKRYYDYSSSSMLSIYSPFFIKHNLSNKKSIGISHGVAWDNEFIKDMNATKFWDSNKNIIESAQTLNNIISVDTNTANWFQTIDFEVSKKIKVVPNYVDTKDFTPRNKDMNGEKVIVSYPRRLYGARGLYLVLDIIDDLLSKHSNVEFHFIGRGFEEDTKHVEEKISKWGDRVKWYGLLPEEMPQAYQISDIVLIPTLYSEGTSLSCLEAMASGNAIVATRVGGLTDLIIDRYNGRLINPEKNELLDTISELIDNKKLRERYADNAIQVSKAFDIKIWNEKWNKIIDEIVDFNVYNKETKESKYVKLYIDGEDIISCKFINLIKKLLEQNCFVVIKTDLEEEILEKMSYGRIQFENIKTNNYYDMPDYIVDNSSFKIDDTNKISINELCNIFNI